MYTIKLSDGTIIDGLTGEVDDLISANEVRDETFAGKMAPVILHDHTWDYPSTMAWGNGKIAYIRKQEDGWHFRIDARGEQDDLNDRLIAENKALNEANAMLTECLLEISEIIYGGE